MSWEAANDNLFIVVPCVRIFSFDEDYHSLGIEWWIGGHSFFYTRNIKI